MSSLALIADGTLCILSMTFYFYLGGKDWRQFMIVGLIFPVIAFILSFMIPESPRYLHASRQYEKLEKNLQYISKINGTKFIIDDADKALLNPSETSFATVETFDEVKQEYSIWRDLKKSKTMINLMILM